KIPVGGRSDGTSMESFVKGDPTMKRFLGLLVAGGALLTVTASAPAQVAVSVNPWAGPQVVVGRPFAGYYGYGAPPAVTYYSSGYAGYGAPIAPGYGGYYGAPGGYYSYGVPAYGTTVYRSYAVPAYGYGYRVRGFRPYYRYRRWWW